MKAKEFIAKRLKKEVKTVFGITGGAIVNLTDSLDKYLNFVNLHHEQACAMAADAYSRIYGFGVCSATSGPAGNNLLTGVACSYFDSVPVLAIAGQVPSHHLKGDSGVRQKGFQETDNLSIFEPITKYSNIIHEWKGVSKKLEEAISEAKNPRKGPAFLEICDDVQRAEADFKEEKFGKINFTVGEPFLKEIEQELRNAKKPIIIIGRGCQDYRKETMEMIKHLQIPYFLTWGAMDMADDYDMFNLRDFGVTPSNYISNYVIKNADYILVLGSRLDTHQPLQTNAKVTQIDVDLSELKKETKGINEELDKVIETLKDLGISRAEWLIKIRDTKRKHKKEKTYANKLVEKLSNLTDKNSTIITDAGQTLTYTMQSWKVKEGQRLFSAFNHSPMGYAVPASIGAYYAHKDLGENRNIICITGDGGLMMNIQELASIGGRKLPIKIFVFDNGGYGMIRQTQSDWKSLRDGVACKPPMPSSHIDFPELPTDYKKMAGLFGFEYYDLSLRDLTEVSFNKIMSEDMPVLIRVCIPKDNKIKPKLKYGDKLTDLTPKLSKKEIKDIEEGLK